MFGSKGTSKEALEKLVSHQKWDKIKKSYLNSDTETQVNLAKACAGSSSDDCVNILVALLDQPEEAVKMAALKSLAQVGNDHTVSQIQQLMTGTPAGQTELRTQIQETLNALRGKK